MKGYDPYKGEIMNYLKQKQGQIVYISDLAIKFNRTAETFRRKVRELVKDGYISKKNSRYEILKEYE